MVVITEMISNWVTWSAAANGCLTVVDLKSELHTHLTYIIAISTTKLYHVTKNTTSDELHENDPGFTIDAVPGSGNVVVVFYLFISCYCQLILHH